MNITWPKLDEAQWRELQAVGFSIGKHSVTSWRADASNTGLYLTHITNSKSWRTYLPAINDLNAITAAVLDSLVDMYTDISNRPRMESKNLVDFIVPQTVQTHIKKDSPTDEEILAVFPQLRQTLNALRKTLKTPESIESQNAYLNAERLENEKMGSRLSLFAQKTYPYPYAQRLIILNIYHKINLTIPIRQQEIAQTLSPSNPKAVKVFVEFLLSNDNGIMWDSPGYRADLA
jgi:hypothetical protein